MRDTPYPMQKQLWGVETDEGIGQNVRGRQSIAGSPLPWHHCKGADPSPSPKTSVPSPGRDFPFPSLLEGWANVHFLSCLCCHLLWEQPTAPAPCSAVCLDVSLILFPWFRMAAAHVCLCKAFLWIAGSRASKPSLPFSPEWWD